MSDFVSAMPKTSGELYKQLTKLQENIKHVNSITVTDTRINVDLDRLANGLGGTPDFYLTLKGGKKGAAEALINRLLGDRNHKPTMGEAEELFALLNTAG